MQQALGGGHRVLSRHVSPGSHRKGSFWVVRLEQAANLESEAKAQARNAMVLHKGQRDWGWREETVPGTMKEVKPAGPSDPWKCGAAGRQGKGKAQVTYRARPGRRQKRTAPGAG